MAAEDVAVALPDARAAIALLGGGPEAHTPTPRAVRGRPPAPGGGEREGWSLGYGTVGGGGRAAGSGRGYGGKVHGEGGFRDGCGQ